jgi:PAS domain S-box-containing protein
MNAARAQSNGWDLRSQTVPLGDDLDSIGHDVQFYTDDKFLLDHLSRVVGSALGAGDIAVVIATETHKAALAKRLEQRGLDVGLAITQGRYVALDALETLNKFMVNDWPDSAWFTEVLGRVFDDAKAAVKGEPRIVAFGEMVALLCADGKSQAAVRVEQLWNEFSKTRAFYLHCAYPMGLFPQAADGTLVQSICDQHQHVSPAEAYTALQTDQERLLAVTLLQQKARALETEIRERRKAQAALQEREAELRDFVENAIVPLHWVSQDGTILWANTAELALVGYDHDEYVGHHIAEFHADAEAINEILRRLDAKEELQGFRAQLRCKNGAIRIVRIYSNVFSRDAEFVHTRCFTIDVTDREHSEGRIAAQLAITRLLAFSTSLAEISEKVLETICGASECDFASIWRLPDDADELQCVKVWHRSNSSFPHFDKQTAEIRFRKGDGLPGRAWETNQAAWISDLGRDENFPRKEAAMTDGLRSAFAFPIAAEGKVWGVLEFLSCQYREPDAEFMTMMEGIGIQIGQFAERKQVQDIRGKLAAIVESCDDAIVSKDLNGIVSSWNKGAERIFGFKAQEIIGRPITTIIPPDLRDDEPKILAKIQAGERIDHFQTVRVTKNGERVEVSLTISPVKDETGKIIGAAKIARDVTQQKKLERALQTTERLAAVGRLAATVAHEINNPLEAVTNFVYLAKTSPDLPENLRLYLNNADKELIRVAHIARQTLGFYRDTSYPVWLDVNVIVNDILTIYERKFDNRSLTVQKKVKSGLRVCALEGELKQVLSNLISNAIDASRAGGAVQVRAHDCTNYRTQTRGLRITVADNGSGIVPENRDKLFAPFFTTKKEIGTGLGLWVARQLIEKAGGQIRFRSRTGSTSGTVMSVFLPLQRESSAAMAGAINE